MSDELTKTLQWAIKATEKIRAAVRDSTLQNARTPEQQADAERGLENVERKVEALQAEARKIETDAVEELRAPLITTGALKNSRVYVLDTTKDVQAFALAVNPPDAITDADMLSLARVTARPFDGAVTGHLRARPVLEGVYTICAKCNGLKRVADCLWPEAFAPYWGWCQTCAEKDKYPMPAPPAAPAYAAPRRRSGLGSTYMYGGAWDSVEVEYDRSRPGSRPPLRVSLRTPPAPVVRTKPAKPRDEDEFTPKNRRKRDIQLE